MLFGRTYEKRERNRRKVQTKRKKRGNIKGNWKGVI
jgi:hypothetical protein